MTNEESLKDIAEWLKRIEHIAGSTYKEASTRLEGNSKLAAFLKHLSDDEAWHFHIMGSASEYFSSSGGTAGISIDDALRAKIEHPFVEINTLLERNELSEKALLPHVLEAEFSEWNDIFLYVVNILKEKSYEFSFGAAKIQQHMHYLRNQIDQFPDCKPCMEIGKELPMVWKEKVLIVEDDPALIALLQAVLSKECSIEIASNGRQALELIRSTYFNAIISDIQMPHMDGIELFSEASKVVSGLVDHFVYYATAPDPEQQEFIMKTGISFIPKPSSLSTIKEAIHGILKKEKLIAS